MRALVAKAYGPPEVLEVVELADPEPGPGQVRVRVRASTVTMGDTELRTMGIPWLFAVPLRLWLGWWRPRGTWVLGMELAGVVDAVGEGVTRPAVGDRVFGAPGMGFGANAERFVLAAEDAHPMPEGLTFEAAATLPVAGREAIGYLAKGGVDGTKRVLIRGASGAIGTYAVQLAKQVGAHVTAVGGPGTAALLEELGADVAWDHTVHDFDADPSARFDVMIDVVGRTPFRRCLAVLAPDGVLVRCTIPGVPEVLGALWVRLSSRQRVIQGEGGGSTPALLALAASIGCGEVKAVIDRVLPLDRAAEAHRYVEAGQKTGHVVLTCDPDAGPGS